MDAGQTKSDRTSQIWDTSYELQMRSSGRSHRRVKSRRSRPARKTRRRPSLPASTLQSTRATAIKHSRPLTCRLGRTRCPCLAHLQNGVIVGARARQCPPLVHGRFVRLAAAWRQGLLTIEMPAGRPAGSGKAQRQQRTAAASAARKYVLLNAAKSGWVK